MGNHLLIDLAGAYELEEQAPHADSSENGNAIVQLAGTPRAVVDGRVNNGATQDTATANRRGIPAPSPYHFSSSFTVSFYIRGSTSEWNNAISDALVGVWDDFSGNQRAWLIYWDASSNQFVFIVSGDGTATTTLQMGTIVPPDEEYFNVAFGYDAMAGEIWGQIAGGARQTLAHAGGIFAASTAPFTFAWAAAFAVEFRMSPYDYDELYIWDRSLPESDIVLLQSTFFPAFTGDPMAYSEVIEALNLRSRSAEAEPSDLFDPELVDLQAAADAESVLIDARGNFVFTIWAAIVANAATAGAFSLFLDLYARDGVTLVEAVELFSAADATTDATLKLQFGLGLTERLTGGGTIGAELASLKSVQLAKLRVVKDTPADTAATVSIRMQLGD